MSPVIIESSIKVAADAITKTDVRINSSNIAEIGKRLFEGTKVHSTDNGIGEKSPLPALSTPEASP